MSHENYRVCTTEELRALVRRADQEHYNRAFTIPDNVSKGGLHLLYLALFGHNMDQGSEDLVHRCEVLLRTEGSEEPTETWLDVAAADWDRLLRVDEVLSQDEQVKVDAEVLAAAREQMGEAIAVALRANMDALEREIRP